MQVDGFHTYFVGEQSWQHAVWAHNAYIGSHYKTGTQTGAGYESHHIGQDAALKTLPSGYSPKAAPTIVLFGGNSSIGSAHYEANQTQIAENQQKRRLGAKMSLAAEAQISLDALKAAFDGKQGSDPNKVLLASDIR